MRVLLVIPSRSYEEFALTVQDEAYEWIENCGFDFEISTMKGYGLSVRNTILEMPGYDVYVTLDNDFAMPAPQAMRLVDGVIKGKADVVVGNRQNRLKTGSPVRGIISRGFNKLIGLAFHTGLQEHFSGFRAFSPKFREQVLPLMTEEHWMMQPEAVIAAQARGLRVIEVPIDYDPSLRPTKLRRLPRDAADIIPGLWRLWRRWGA